MQPSLDSSQAKKPARLRPFVTRTLATGRLVLARESFRAAIILLLILNINFFPFIWGHKTMLASAEYSSVLPNGAWGKHSGALTYPKTLDEAAAAWVTESSLAVDGWYLRTKTLPLWNPYQALGEPYAAAMQQQPFYPLALLFALHLTPKTYNLFLLSRLFLLGFGAYLYLRLFVSFIPSLAAGIAAMLAGYFLLAFTTPYLSVETLIPMTLFLAELLLRRPGRNTVATYAFIVALVILAGMPESSFLLYLYVSCYAVFRIAFDADLRSAWFKRGLAVVIATLIGLCLAAFLLWPLAEFVRHSYNVHDPTKNAGYIPAMWHDRFDQSAWTYVFPLLLGPLYAPTLVPYNYNGNGARNYFGVIALFLVLVAAFSNRRSTAPGERRNSNSPGSF